MLSILKFHLLCCSVYIWHRKLRGNNIFTWRINCVHGNRKCKMVRNDETDQRKKNRLYVEKENRLCCFFFFFVTSNQFIIICLASDFHSLCRCFSTFCKLIPIGWMRIQQMFSVFIANAFYMSGLWLASGYALGVIVYAVEFVFFFLSSSIWIIRRNWIGQAGSIQRNTTET